MHKESIAALATLALIILTAPACRKKMAMAPPPPPSVEAKVEQAAAPAPKPPVISEFRADPAAIERGQFTTLRWSTQGATEALIDPSIGTVPTTGARQIQPDAGVTYTLRARGPGGATTAQATVSVAVPPPAPPPPPRKTLTDRLALHVVDAHFDFNRSDLRSDARDVLTMNAAVLKGILKDFPDAAVVIEGHCDERGSAEYNLALGDRRARESMDFLVELGVPRDRLRIISYGKERPQCAVSTEACWQSNRRAHFASANQEVTNDGTNMLGRSASRRPPGVTGSGPRVDATTARCSASQ
jgi:peptidoglycan-associated lipoprotein